VIGREARSVSLIAAFAGRKSRQPDLAAASLASARQCARGCFGEFIFAILSPTLIAKKRSISVERLVRVPGASIQCRSVMTAHTAVLACAWIGLRHEPTGLK